MSSSETQSFAQFKHKQVGGLWYLLSTTLDAYMTGLLHEGKFHVRDLLEPAIFGSLHWAYVMCNWAQILLHMRH